MKRPFKDKLSSIKLTLEEYEGINFLDDDDDEDPSAFITIKDEDDSKDPPRDDSGNPSDEDSSVGHWNQNYDKYNLW